jgi:hypothetical protein
VKPYDYKACGKHLVHHVGYLRFDLADVIPEIGASQEAADAEDSDPPYPAVYTRKPPSYEVVHRFDFEELELLHQPKVGDKTDMTAENILAANVHEVDPYARMRRNLFSNTPPEKLLMRMILRGGVFEKATAKGFWYFDGTLRDGNTPYSAQLSGTAVWNGTIDEDHIAIRIRSWKRKHETIIRLRPSKGGKVRLKIANLCAQNPMEWPELYPRVFDSPSDDDFKWFYFLWRDTRDDFDKLLDGPPPQLLPVPCPDPMHGDIINCGPASMQVDNVENGE